jgi:hypothetical protein
MAGRVPGFSRDASDTDEERTAPSYVPPRSCTAPPWVRGRSPRSRREVQSEAADLSPEWKEQTRQGWVILLERLAAVVGN